MPEMTETRRVWFVDLFVCDYNSGTRYYQETFKNKTKHVQKKKTDYQILQNFMLQQMMQWF